MELKRLAIKLEVVGAKHDVSAVAIVESSFNHLVHHNSVQVDEVVQKSGINGTLHIAKRSCLFGQLHNEVFSGKY